MSLFFVIFYAALFSFFIRTEFIHKVRISFIDDERLFPEKYHSLPPYFAMTFSPKYWGLWTKSQWMQWSDC